MKQIGERFCGACSHIVSGRRKFIGNKKENYFNEKSWDTLKEQSILVPAEESYAPLAAHIINSCKRSNCNKQINKFKVKIDELESVEKFDKKRFYEKGLNGEY
jgi:hypothetical protein